MWTSASGGSCPATCLSLCRSTTQGFASRPRWLLVSATGPMHSAQTCMAASHCQRNARRPAGDVHQKRHHRQICLPPTCTRCSAWHTPCKAPSAKGLEKSRRSRGLLAVWASIR